jgi:hypothetical protein
MYHVHVYKNIKLVLLFFKKTLAYLSPGKWTPVRLKIIPSHSYTWIYYILLVSLVQFFASLFRMGDIFRFLKTK